MGKVSLIKTVVRSSECLRHALFECLKNSSRFGPLILHLEEPLPALDLAQDAALEVLLQIVLAGRREVAILAGEVLRLVAVLVNVREQRVPVYVRLVADVADQALPATST